MSQAPYFREQGYNLILTETNYSDQDRKILHDSLILLKAILSSTEGRSLSAEEVKKVNSGFKREGKPQRITKGGQSALFAFEFQMRTLQWERVIVKPYLQKKVSLASLATHYIAVIEFKTLFQDLPLPGLLRNGSERDFLVKCVDILGFGELKDNDYSFPILLQEKAQGTLLEKAGRFAPRNMSAITKDIAKHGFIIDPFDQNWRLGAGFIDEDVVTKLEYIDVLLMNANEEQRKRIKKALSLLEKTSS